MSTFVNLYSQKKGELNRFLSTFYNTDLEISDSLKWNKNYDNPLEIAELIGIFADNIDKYLINMWVCLDKNIYISINDKNADKIIKYLYERYPY